MRLSIVLPTWNERGNIEPLLNQLLPLQQQFDLEILVVDDDTRLRELLKSFLSRNGFRVTAASSASEARQRLQGLDFDLIVLDVMMPGQTGLEFAGELRRTDDVPILMLTAMGDPKDRIAGLEKGVDDYLGKPFEPRELLARIKSILRRTRTLPENLQPDEARRLTFAGWALDTATRNLRSPAGVVVALSGTEFRLLRIFLAHPNRVLNRDQLIDLMLSRDASPFDRSIDVQVSRLRHRLEDDAKEPAIIKTVRGQGYVLAAEVVADS